MSRHYINRTIYVNTPERIAADRMRRAIRHRQASPEASHHETNGTALPIVRGWGEVDEIGKRTYHNDPAAVPHPANRRGSTRSSGQATREGLGRAQAHGDGRGLATRGPGHERTGAGLPRGLDAGGFPLLGVNSLGYHEITVNCGNPCRRLTSMFRVLSAEISQISAAAHEVARRNGGGCPQSGVPRTICAVYYNMPAYWPGRYGNVQ